ncbi:hypothetical protein [Ulvibacterium marinum]|nr:hypothetical protein [Ulvibacterium marinum]
MKRIYMYMIGFSLLSVGLISCEEDEKDPMQVHLDEANKAPYVRIQTNARVLGASELPTSSFDATVEALENNVASWDVTVTLEQGGEAAAGPAALTTVTSFPSDFSFTYPEIATALGLGDISEIVGGNVLRFLGTATGTDGRVVTQDNLSGSILGQAEQLQAFNFIVTVDCSPISDVSVGGTWNIDIFDSFGDGWDGAFLTFTVNGVDTVFTIAGGSEGNFTIDVPAGAELFIRYTSGAFEEEHTFTLTSPEGPYGDFGPNPLLCVN